MEQLTQKLEAIVDVIQMVDHGSIEIILSTEEAVDVIIELETIGVKFENEEDFIDLFENEDIISIGKATYGRECSYFVSPIFDEEGNDILFEADVIIIDYDLKDCVNCYYLLGDVGFIRDKDEYETNCELDEECECCNCEEEFCDTREEEFIPFCEGCSECNCVECENISEEELYLEELVEDSVLEIMALDYKCEDCISGIVEEAIEEAFKCGIEFARKEIRDSLNESLGE